MSKAKIYYHDIGDYLSRDEKLNIVKKFGSMANIPWKELSPNEQGDWIAMRNESFDSFITLASEKKFDVHSQSFFIIGGPGIMSGRDYWLANFSTKMVKETATRLIENFNQEVDKYQDAIENKKEYNFELDSTKISWSSNLRNDLERRKKIDFDNSPIYIQNYRPFNKLKFYFNKRLIDRPGISNILFPNSHYENKVIVLTGNGSSKDFTTIMSNSICDRHFDSNGQCFPLYFYEENKSEQKGLFDDDSTGSSSDYIRRDGVSDFILERATTQYNTKDISKEDIFYYVYGFLHSPNYRETFANDLKKMLPRLPLVDDVRDFWAFSKAGRNLAELHLNYESVPAYEGVTLSSRTSDNLGASDNTNDYRVEKMRFPKKDQKDTIIYNSKITISNIPAEAYEYVVNGKSAIEWIMERYAITTHKDSGITNDPNDWANEVGNPRYILDLLLSIINVSVQTVEIVKGLPGVKFE
jgi:predicted helicase